MNTEVREIVKLSTGETFEYDRSRTVLDLFLEWTAASPDNPAVADENSSFSYRELDEASDKVASYLINNGVKEDDFVAVRMDRVKEFHTAVFGIWKARAAYVPIDMDCPEGRMADMLEDSGAKITLTEELVSKILSNTAPASERKLPTPENLAYMIYTSGSTGKPKGVMIQHKALLNFVHFIRENWQMTEQSRISCHVNFAFDASVEDLFSVLTAGGCVFIVPEEARHDIFAMREFIKKHGITGGNYSTQFGQLLGMDYELPVDYINIGGEAMTVIPKARGRVLNTYGPTEFTVCATWFELEKGKTYSPIPIGRPLWNCSAFIVSEKGELLPQGEEGELCLAGPQLAKGYWNRPELTAEKFNELSVDGEMVRVYHTGDLAKYNEDGDLEFCGRKDFQVKLRGFRIELGEIESRAGQYKGIKQAAAEVKKNQLALYYVAEDGVEIDTSGLRGFLAETLAEYMVPAAYMPLLSMPLTPNGKIDRKALPEPVFESGEELVLPETVTEEKLTVLASNLLETEKDSLSVTANLVSYGMSSIGAMRLAALIHSEFGVSISVANMLKNPTIRAIAGIIDRGTQDSDEVRITVHEKQPYYPITENQRGLIIEWQLHPQTSQYNIPEVVVFENTKADELAQAIKKAVDAHSFLKTRFETKDGDIVQVPHYEDAVEVSITALSEAPVEGFFQSRVRPFDLFADRLYRLEIYTFDKTNWLFMDMHHTVFDGLSDDVFLDDVKADLHGEALTGETVTAYDYALYEQELKESSEWGKAESYFDDLLSDAAVASIPDSENTDGTKTGAVTLSLPGKEIDAFCAHTGVTPGSFFQAAFAETIRRISREDSPMYTTISSGRAADARLQDSVGMFVRTLPVVCTDGKGQTTEEYVKAFHEQLQKTFEMEYYPYTAIVDKYRLKAEMMFAWQAGIYGEDTDNKFELALDEGKMPVDVTAYPEGESYVLMIEYDGERYGRTDMKRLASAVKNVALEIAAKENMSEVCLLNEEETEAVLTLSKGETLEYDRSLTWMDLFKAQVIKTPDKEAVVAENGSFTYAELDRASDSIAEWLTENGAKGFVAVRIGRVKEFHAAVLGIHKAGLAYVPVDLDYPEERVNFMLEDSGASVTLTEDKVGEILCKLTSTFTPLCTPDSPAYMIYTSGSTGKPKGAMISHRALLNFIHFIRKNWNLGEESRISLHCNFSFDASVEDIFPPLTVGGTIYVVPESTRRDILEMRKFIEHYHINGGNYSTQFGQLLGMDYELPVDYINLGGEAMTVIPQARGRVLNTYGPTEFTVDATWFEVEKGREYKNIPIGRPLDNCAGYVVDINGQLLPRGFAGELCLSGPQIGDGYHNRPELTEKSFTDCPFLPGEKMYHTGDLVRYNEAGELEYLGRIDTQVKLRGFRIELGEIESRAGQYEGIKQAAAKVKNNQLALYYVAEDGMEIDKQELRNFLGETLAEYMVPAAYMPLPSMPLTPNGKIDRKALPEPV